MANSTEAASGKMGLHFSRAHGQKPEGRIFEGRISGIYQPRGCHGAGALLTLQLYSPHRAKALATSSVQEKQMREGASVARASGSRAGSPAYG